MNKVRKTPRVEFAGGNDILGNSLTRFPNDLAIVKIAFRVRLGGGPDLC